MSNSCKSVVIIGGGVTGLLAAVSLSRIFEKVTVFEQDQYPDKPGGRPNVSHGNQVHVLLARGLTEITKIIPEAPQWLDEYGFEEGDLTADIWASVTGKWMPRKPSGVPIRQITRPIMETLMLRAIKQIDNIEIKAGTKVLELVGERQITAIRYQDNKGKTSEFSADFFLDVAGRTSKAIPWLEQRGLGPVEIDIVDPNVKYSSMSFQAASKVDIPCDFIVDFAQIPDQGRFGVLQKTATDKWLATIISIGNFEAPNDEESFVNEFKKLSTPYYYDNLIKMKPTSKLQKFYNTKNRRRRFAKLKWWPDRYIILGDAASTLNPRYGQGITVGAIGVRMISDMLEAQKNASKSLDNLAFRFQKQLDKVTEIPWQTVLMEDRLWAATMQSTGLSLKNKIMVAMTKRLQKTMYQDFQVYVTINRVAHLIDSPLKLFSPTILAKIAIPALRRI